MPARFQILATDRLSSEGLELLRQHPDFDVTIRAGLSERELSDIISRYDALIVRSATRVTSTVLARPGRLRIVSRAGVGVDNVDLSAATAAGVLVMNTPDANTLSTAEHALALMLALARRIAAAHAHVAAGGWERGRFEGVQLAGKTLGVVGLGRVGRAVAARALALEMRVLALDPLVAEPTALDGRVKVCAHLSELLRQADVVSLHAALTERSRRLIDAAALAEMRPSALLINCARGELVDERALADALRAGRLAGAAVDVFSTEPPRDNPLIGLPNVLHTPHLGASTAEAQRAAGLDAVRGVIEYLRDGVARYAVNVVDLPRDLAADDLDWTDLADRVGRLLAPRCLSGLQAVRIVAGAGRVGRLAAWLGRHVLVRLLAPHFEGPLSVVNALELAAERAIRVESVGAADRADALAVDVQTPDARHRVEAVLGARREPRIRMLDGHALDMTPEGHMVVVLNQDRPGVIGLVATAFGDAGVNIADLSVSRRGVDALMLFKLDQAPPPDVLHRLRGHAPLIRDVYTVELPALRAAAEG